MNIIKSLLENNSTNFNIYFNSLLTSKLIEKLTYEKPIEYIMNPKLKVGSKIPFYDLSGTLKIGIIKRTLKDLKDITLELKTGEIIEYQVSRNATAKYWLMYDLSPETMDGLIETIGTVDNAIYAPLIVK